MATAPPSAWPAEVDVLALDLDARDRESAEVPSAIGKLCDHARVFLKIDSTLRGPVRSLIDSALRISRRSTAVVAPAFPEQGRTVRDGRLYVHDEPGPRVAHIVGDHLVWDGDLRALAHQSESHPEWLLVGSAGLARQLAPPATPPDIGKCTDVLVVAGSPSPVTRAQLQLLSAVEVLATPPTDTRDAGEAAQALAEAAAHRHPQAAVLTGGATARAVIHRVAATHVRILGELQPGIPIGVLDGGSWHGVTIVTKAGGFGTPGTLLDVVRALGPS